MLRNSSDCCLVFNSGPSIVRRHYIIDMGRKRASSDDLQGGSKRVCTNDNAEDVDDENIENDDSTSEDERVGDCSQRPDFIPQAQLTEAENGIIEKVTVQNFMCHSNLVVNLGPNVNFIIGRNGSGKSAIMTAIVVGLGGKASTTNRGNSLKGFVKDKCSTAIIRIQLRNRGTDAFKPDRYGSFITVERKLSCDGTGAYKIMSENGNVMSTKKEELNHILDQFNIQIDNPVSILNQDTSRNFLCASNPEGKYKFFLKATQLEQMSNDYLTIQERQEIIKITLEKKRETIPEMENEVQQLEEKYKDLEQLKVLEGKIEELKREIAWAQVIEKEKKLRPVISNINAEKERVPKYDEKLQECETNIAIKEADWTKVKTELEGITSESDQLKGRQQDINDEVKKIKAVVRNHQNDLRKIERDLQNTEKEKCELQKRIEDITANAMQDIESERLERERSIQEKREELQAIQFQLNTTNNHKNQLEKNVTRANEQIYQIRNDVADARKNIDQSNRRLNSLRDGQKDHLKRFGSSMPELLRQVETAVRRGRFHKPPKGPVGARIKLRDEFWAVAVETCLKNLGFAFCCTDSHDRLVLRELMKGLFPTSKMPQIVVGKFQDNCYDVSNNKPRCNYPTIVDVLEIEDPVIFNCIVDQTRAECILLIKNTDEARDVMFNRPPANATKAFAGNGDQIFGGKSAKSYAYTGSGTSYLKGNIEDEIRRVQLRCQEENNKFTQLKSDLDHQERNMRELQGELKRSKTKSMKEQDVHNKILQEISELEQFEEEAVPDVTVLQEDVNNLTQQLEEFNTKNDGKQKEFLQAKKALDEANLESNTHKAKIQEVIGKAEPLTASLNAIEVDLATAKSHRKHYRDKKKEMVEKISKMEAELGALKNEVEEANRLASEYCERVETRRSVKSLDSEILQTERRLRAEQQTRGQIEEITKQFVEAKDRLNAVQTNMKSLARFSKRLGHVLKQRLVNFTHYRKLITIRAKQHFRMMLSQRGYTGKMKLDHNNEQLILQVNVDQTLKAGSNNSKSLSGGERSFSTISFIMALWDSMEAPFRCLDEFDVFMDMMNRRISMQMMMKVAMEQRYRQFILLTPQDMSNVGGGKLVKIFRLQDPERGQAILPFEPVTSQ